MMNASTAELEQHLELGVGDLTLEGSLAVPRDAQGMVVFAHGSGSSRQSARNRYVAGVLHRRRFATLLLDLLTTAEEARDALDAHLRFDIRLLADRLEEATDWLASYDAARNLPIGYFGAGTAAAAALLAAVERRASVQAIVARSGRPDLVHDMLARVQVPTLLIVGGHDTAVLEVNREALGHLAGRKELAVVPGATHMFDEPGTLDQAAQLAGSWFADHLYERRSASAT